MRVHSWVGILSFSVFALSNSSNVFAEGSRLDCSAQVRSAIGSVTNVAFLSEAQLEYLAEFLPTIIKMHQDSTNRTPNEVIDEKLRFQDFPGPRPLEVFWSSEITRATIYGTPQEVVLALPGEKPKVPPKRSSRKPKKAREQNQSVQPANANGSVSEAILYLVTPAVKSQMEQLQLSTGKSLQQISREALEALFDSKTNEEIAADVKAAPKNRGARTAQAYFQLKPVQVDRVRELKEKFAVSRSPLMAYAIEVYLKQQHASVGVTESASELVPGTP